MTGSAALLLWATCAAFLIRTCNAGQLARHENRALDSREVEGHGSHGSHGSRGQQERRVQEGRHVIDHVRAKSNTTIDVGGTGCSSYESPLSASFDDETRQRLIASPGESWLWQGLSDKLARRVPLTVLLMGGSVEVRPWVGLLETWLQGLSPGSRLVNGAKASTGSKYHFEHLMTCGAAETSLLELKPDLVILDTSVNPWPEDGQMRAPRDTTNEAFYVEKIVRTMLQLEFRPAVMFLEWLTDGASTMSLAPYFTTNEDAHMQVLRYYGITSCSLRDALWPQLKGPYAKENLPLQARSADALNLGALFVDALHPNDAGGQVLTELLSYCICAAAGRGSDDGPIARRPTALPMALQQLPSNGSGFPLHSQSAEDGISERTLEIRGNATSVARDTLSVISVGMFLGWSLLADATALPPGTEPPVPRATAMAGSWGIRLFAHMHIVVMHYYQLMPDNLASFLSPIGWRFANYGQCWVPMFFVLSGFIAYLSDKSEAPSLAASVAVTKRRLKRYYPMFALGLWIALFSPNCREYMQDNVVLAVSTVFLLQTWIPPYGAPQINGPSWYLSNLIFLAVAAPFLCQKVRACGRPHLLLVWCFVTSLLTPSLIDHLGWVPLLDSGLNAYLQFTVFCNWPLFVAGIVLARLFGDYAVERDREFFRWGVVFSMGWTFFFFLFAELTDLPMRWLNHVFLPPAYACLVVSMAFERDALMEVCARVPCEEWLTNSAWCVYIIHVPLFLTYGTLVHGLLDIRQPVLFAALALAVAAAASKLVDEPLQAWLKQRPRKASTGQYRRGSR